MSKNGCIIRWILLTEHMRQEVMSKLFCKEEVVGKSFCAMDSQKSL